MTKQALILSFHLTAPEKNLAYMEKGIKALGTWVMLAPNTYVVQSDASPAAVRDKLSFVLEPSDKLYVGTVSAPAAWWGFSEVGTKALRNML